jgi:hypothetical protein
VAIIWPLPDRGVEPYIECTYVRDKRTAASSSCRPGVYMWGAAVLFMFYARVGAMTVWGVMMKRLHDRSAYIAQQL